MGSVAQFNTELPHDPREQAVVDPYERDPMGTPFINIPAPAPFSGADDASIFRAKRDQMIERNELLAERAETSERELFDQQLIDTHSALRLEQAPTAWPPDMSTFDKREAAQVAIRLSDPMWQTISRYHAAQAVLLVLRKELSALGIYMTEKDVRYLADKSASVAQTARMRVWTGQTHVGPTEWSRAKFNFLNVTEEL